MRPLKRVRIYARRGRFLLQWWDPGGGKTSNERVDGDLFDAISRARQVEARLDDLKTSGPTKRRLSHEELIDRYVSDLHKRADGAQMSVATVARYESALRHYRHFIGETGRTKAFPYASNANRELRLKLAAYLEELPALAGCHGARPASGRSARFVMAAVRSMYAWATDPDGANLLPAEFRNPFGGTEASHRKAAVDTFRPPDISTAMAVDLVTDCDAFQLPLFASLALFGLGVILLGRLDLLFVDGDPRTLFASAEFNSLRPSSS
jgi:hypothetical protein